MKKLITAILILLSALLATAQVAPAKTGSTYGSAIDEKGAISVDELAKRLETEKKYAGKVKGKVVSVCQEKGCWMKLTQADGETIMIRFKDYKFFVPKNIDGKEVILDGVVSKSITSVEMLKHYASDAGKSNEEIAEITEPKNEITITASGVLVL